MTADGIPKSIDDDMTLWAGRVGTEARKSFLRWHRDGFLKAYLSGRDILDIGYRGYGGDAEPILPWAIGIELDYPGYDGRRLPFDDFSQDTIFTSHVLEHIDDHYNAIRDWFRVLREGGHMITIVPHQYLYERSRILPSKWNWDHKRFYTAGSLLREFEEALDPIQYRVRLLEDNDRGFGYDTPPDVHGHGCYELVLVIEKIARPFYTDRLDQEAADARTAAGVAANDPVAAPVITAVAAPSNAAPRSRSPLRRVAKKLLKLVR